MALYESNLWSALGLTTHGVPFNRLGKKIHDVNQPDSAENWDATTHITSDEGLKLSTRLVFKTLKDQRVPLEISVKTRMNGDTQQYYTETYIDCWLSSYSKAYSVGTITVAEQATIQYSDVY